jgi:hypothetical protein
MLAAISPGLDTDFEKPLEASQSSQRLRKFVLQQKVLH